MNDDHKKWHSSVFYSSLAWDVAMIDCVLVGRRSRLKLKKKGLKTAMKVELFIKKTYNSIFLSSILHQYWLLFKHLHSVSCHLCLYDLLANHQCHPLFHSPTLHYLLYVIYLVVKLLPSNFHFVEHTNYKLWTNLNVVHMPLCLHSTGLFQKQ